MRKLGVLCVVLALVGTFATVVSADTLNDGPVLVLDQTDTAPQMCIDQQLQPRDQEQPVLESCYPPECSSSADCFGARCFQKCCWF